MRFWLLELLPVMLVSHHLVVVVADYRRNFCICQLNSYLADVKSKLGQDEEVIYVPTTTVAPTTTEEPDNSETQTRRKRETVEEEETRNYDNGVPNPFGSSVVFNTDLKMLEDEDGVSFDDEGVASLCPCTPGSFVRVKICLLSLKYKDDYGNPKSDLSKKLTGELLPWLDVVLHKALETTDGLYVRSYMEEYVKFGDNVQMVFQVELNKTFAPDHVVKNALEPALRDDEILTYETDITDEDSGCITTEDLTPEENIDTRLLSDIRYIFIGVALAFLVLIFLFTCFGSADKFYIRFW